MPGATDVHGRGNAWGGRSRHPRINLRGRLCLARHWGIGALHMDVQEGAAKAERCVVRGRDTNAPDKVYFSFAAPDPIRTPRFLVATGNGWPNG